MLCDERLSSPASSSSSFIMDKRFSPEGLSFLLAGSRNLLRFKKIHQVTFYRKLWSYGCDLVSWRFSPVSCRQMLVFPSSSVMFTETFVTDPLEYVSCTVLCGFCSSLDNLLPCNACGDRKAQKPSTIEHHER